MSTWSNRSFAFIGRCLVVGSYYYLLYKCLEAVLVNSGSQIMMLLFSLFALGWIINIFAGLMKTPTTTSQKILGVILDWLLRTLILRPGAWALGIPMNR